MSDETTPTLRLYRAVHPGEILRDELEARRMTQVDLAARMARPVQVVNDIVREKKGISAQTARDLEIVLGTPAYVWLNLQSSYELTRARLQDEQRIASETADLEHLLTKRLNVAELIKRGWIEKRETLGAQAYEVLAFFGARSFQSIERTQTAAAFRVTPGAKVEPWRLAAWMRGGELIAEQLELPAPFDHDAFSRLLPELRPLTRTATPWPALQDRCAEAGVAVAGVPHLPKSGANGVAYWLGRDRPVIQLSLRNKRADIFWFTFFHEAAHLLEGYRRDAIIELDDMPRDNPHDSEAERAADQFAADTLIPPDAWQTFPGEEQITEQTITAFADAVGIHPGIVVGRLQFEKLIPYNRHNNLRTSLDPDLFTPAPA